MRFHCSNIWSNTWNKYLEPILNWHKLKYGCDSHIFSSPPTIIIYTQSGLFWGSETNQEGRDKRSSVLPVNSGIKLKGSTPILLVQSSRDISFLSRGYRSERWWHISAPQGWPVRNYTILNFYLSVPCIWLHNKEDNSFYSIFK